MPRYIEECDVYKLVEPTGSAKIHCSQIDALPRADVVPKSEVERLNKKIDVLKRDRYQVFPDGRLELLPITDLDKIKAEVAREIFEAVLDVYKNTCDADFEEEFAELKKKYTEGE
jgi:hypothetical protein